MKNCVQASVHTSSGVYSGIRCMYVCYQQVYKISSILRNEPTVEYVHYIYFPLFNLSSR